MSGRCRRASAVGIAMLVAVGHAHAETDEAAAEREFRIGYRSLQAGNCADALVHYRRSLELVPRPRTLFNIATCEEDLGQQAAAWRDYQSFLTLAEDRDAAIVVDARTRIDALRKRLRGQISVDSNPGGASVTVDGERQVRGETPTTLSLEPGRHVLRVSLAGAVADERVVEIAPEDRSSLHVELALGSRISIQTDPADAVIERPGGTPTTIGHLELAVTPGPHTFDIHRAGYRSEHVEIDALSGRTHELRINLRPLPATATLVVGGAPDLNLRIDGTSTSASMPRELAIGDHDVVLEREHRVIWRRGLQFSPGELVRLDVDVARPRSRARQAIGWTIGGVGVATLTVGGVVGTLALQDVTSDSADQHARGKTRALVADGLFAVGATALVVAWRLLRNSDSVSARVSRENGSP